MARGCALFYITTHKGELSVTQLWTSIRHCRRNSMFMFNIGYNAVAKGCHLSINKLKLFMILQFLKCDYLRTVMSK